MRLRSMMEAYASPDHTVVGVGVRDGEPFYHYLGAEPLVTPCEDVIFEIGSITKAFTAILMCLLDEECEVDSKVPVCDMADELAVVPDWISRFHTATG